MDFNILPNIYESEKHGILTIFKDGDSLFAGYSTNCGTSKQFECEIDDCFSEDENLQYFIEMIEQQREA